MTTLERVARAISPIPYGDDTSAIQAAIDAMRPEIESAFQRGVVAGLEAAYKTALGFSGAGAIQRIIPTTIKDIDHANAARNY
jgi:hypothetical protein